MGLLLPHKRTLRVYPDMISVSPPSSGGQAGGGKRNEIKVFSSESRYRLIRMMHTLEFDRVTFATLTYPADFPTEAKKYKAHLKEYRRRFERLYGPLRAVWRLEFQKRGAPHYHLMYLNAPFIAVTDWCGMWSDVIKTKDENHRKIGVDVKLVASGGENRLVMSYLAKYVGKVDNATSNSRTEKPGRWWGKWNLEEQIPIEISLGSRQAESVVSYALASRRCGDTWEPTDRTVCTVFGEHMGSGSFRSNIVRFVDEAFSPK